MKSRPERIAALKAKIAELTEKWTKLKNRISKLEQTRRTLLKQSKVERDRLILADARSRIDNDPKELEMFRQRLTDEERASFDSVSKDVRDIERDTPDSPTHAATTPRPAANSVDGAPADAPDADAADADTPDPTANAAPDESRSRDDDLDGDAAPAKQRPTQVAATNHTAPDTQDPRATVKQLDFIKALIIQSPEEARKIGIDATSLSTLSRKKASWVIKRLKG